MKILDYEGLKQVVSKIKGLIDKKADKAEFTRLSESFKFIDTRDTNESPIYYIKNKPKQLVKEFKNLKSIGVNSSSDYCLLITMYPWQDNSVGYPVQMAFILKSDEIYTRRGISDTAWGRWRRILDDTDLKTKLSQLSQDSTHRLVTDSEKTKWNAKAEKSYVDSAKASADENAKTLTDALAKDLRENVDNINATKADKTDLNNYVKKVSGKGLSTNDFTDAYKSKLDRINAENTDAGKIMKLAIETYNSMELWSSNNLYESLNGYYGLNLSSSIKTYEDFKRSDTAARAAANNSKVIKHMMEDEVVSSKMFGLSAARDVILENETSYKQLLSSSIARENMFTNKYFVRDIYKTARNVEILSEDNACLKEFIEVCPYIYYFIAYSSGPKTYTGRYYIIGSGRDATINNIISTPELDKDSLMGVEKISTEHLCRWDDNIKNGKPDKLSKIAGIIPMIRVSKNALITEITHHYEGVRDKGQLIVLDLDMLEADIAKEG